jgi:hypothetical protein
MTDVEGLLYNFKLGIPSIYMFTCQEFICILLAYKSTYMVDDSFL